MDQLVNIPCKYDRSSSDLFNIGIGCVIENPLQWF